ncbi:MAG TPA: DUF6502 family protein [Steroidobacteraceae bacterium]|jgi:hypothetical protein|nr:DUF6502 family protein [Steroidobacteraceae bacterium]
MAQAAISALEPLVELFLELGITSPEAESLWRGVFVHKCREWLSRRERGEPPSDVRVALVSGVHRNFVSQLLAEPPKIAAGRERKGHRAARMLDAWHRDPVYLDSSGKPRDLPERGAAPSFEALASTHMRGAPVGALLRELYRAGAVDLLADRRIRVRTRGMRLPGVTLANLNQIGRCSAAYLRTLIHNLQQPHDPWLNEALTAIEVAPSRVPLVREVIYRRTVNFLQSLEAELASEQRRSATTKTPSFVSIAIFEPTEEATK